MKKRIITTVAALATMTVGAAYAQDATTTTAGVPMVKLNNGVLMPQFGLEERVFNISKEDAEKFFLSVKMKD